MARPNRHVLALTGETLEWHPPFSGAGLPPNCVYFGEVLREMEEISPDHDLTFIITRSTTSLPIPPNRRTVVIIVEDEWCRWPLYAPRVLACFKVFGTRPTHLETVPVRMDLLYMASVLQRLRVAYRTTGHRWAQRRASLRGYTDNVMDIPVGSGHTVDVEVRPLRDRPWDIAFLGSIDNGNTRGAWRRLLASPKTISRVAMLEALAMISAQRPELRILTTEASGYHAAVASDPIEYSTALASSKIALTPRGTNPETFRYFEAHRTGAIPVGEPLPRRPFYDQKPEYTVRRWSDLPTVLERLLDEGPTRAAEEEQERVIRTWETTYSPKALAGRMSDFLLQMKKDES